MKEHTATLSKEVCDTGEHFSLAHKPVVRRVTSRVQFRGFERSREEKEEKFLFEEKKKNGEINERETRTRGRKEGRDDDDD